MAPAFHIDSRPPFQDPMESLGVQPYEVLKIKNVPYSVTIPEIKHFVARLTPSALIRDHQQGFPVHIIMERPTGKTMDCFVEFQNKGAVSAALQRAGQISSGGRPLKMGSRHVEVDRSTEGELCATLFPRAKSVSWDSRTGVPTVVDNDDIFSEGFQGFFTIEEINSVLKHAANPHKATFGQRCQQRVYESMISTLYKFPWHNPLHYSVNARNFLWSAYMQLLDTLMAKVQPGTERTAIIHQPDREIGLSHTLLMEYICAGLNVHMFSLRQKFMIVHAAGPLGPGFELPRQAVGWPFQALVPAPNCAPDVLDEWLDILDAGYRKVAAASDDDDDGGYAYGKYFRLGRDETGYLDIKVNDDGRALSFHQLISMEKGLMEFLVEQGRADWCEAYGVAYNPLNLWSRPYYTYESVGAPQDFRNAMRSFDSTHVADRDYGGDSGGSSEHLGSPLMGGRDDETRSDDEQAAWFKDRTGRKRGAFSTSMITFNPTTPPFIPSEPWTGPSVNRHGTIGDKMPAKTTQQPHSADDSLSRALVPSWTFQQQSSASRDFDTGVEWSPSSKAPIQTRRQTLSYDTLDSTFSPPGTHHQVRARANMRSAASSPGNYNTAVAGRTLQTPDLTTPTKPMLSNIWSYQAGEPSAHASPSRRAVSADSALASESPTRHARYNLSTATSISSFTGPFGSSTLSVAEQDFTTGTLPQAVRKGTAATRCGYQTPPGKNVGRPWMYGSPSYGDRKTSSGRNTVHIHPTIEEEGELSAGETVDGDVGGVSL